nr:isochorismatase family cysteine hydrolase [Achromobacter sp. UMC46]
MRRCARRVRGVRVKGADAAVLALHYQNDVLHPDGKIRVGLDADSGARQRLLDNAAALLDGARARSLPIVHVRIAFRPDYADLLPNCAIFRNVATIGAVPEGQWGSAFYEGLQPLAGSAREFVVKHTRISAFYGTPLEETLRVIGARRLVVAGVATHSVVEGTVRHAADIGFDVMVAEDACASADEAVHQASLASMRLIAQTGSVADAVRWAAAPH